MNIARRGQGVEGRYFRKDRIPSVIKQVNEETVGEVEEFLDVTFLILSIMSFLIQFLMNTMYSFRQYYFS